MSAPKFSSSYPPSFSSFPDLGPNSNKPRSPQLVHDKTRKKGDSKKDKRDKKEQDYLRDEQRKDSSLRDDEQSRPVFYSDRNGDPLNIRYGSMHAGDVPKYHLVGRGRKILGLSNAWNVVRRVGKGVEISIGSRQKMPSLTDSQSRALLTAAPRRTLLQSDDTYKYEEIDGFLPLPSRRVREDDQTYRSIMLSKDQPNSDSESSASEGNDGSSSDSSDTTLLTSHQFTLKNLEQHLSSDPSSILTWLSLLSHSLSAIPITSKNATRSRAEITLSILSRALSAHPANKSSVLLRLKYLKAGEEVWHESKLRAEWEDVLDIGEAEIWLEWLEWRIRKGGKGVDGVVEDARRVLDSLGDREIAKVRVFWRVAVVFQNAGFTERATAMFQAQAELMFKVPQALYGVPLVTQLDGLEEFWESEVPRVGETEARGWAAWVSSGRPNYIPVGLSPSAADVSEKSSDPYCQWAQEESHSDRTLRLPARSSDEHGGVSDPYATVLFTDIRPLLLSLQSTEAKDAFRLTWLSLLGLHIPGFCSSLSIEPKYNGDDRWSYTHMMAAAYLRSIFPPDGSQRRMTADAHTGVLVGREKEYASDFGPMKNWAHGVIGPLECIEGKAKAVSWGREDMMEVDEGFVRRVFGQLRTGVDAEWDCLALAFEAAVNIKGALRLSRVFLSTARDSLPLWAAHARLERLRGRPDDARKVYQTVLSSCPPSASQLWWDWAEMEWLEAKSDSAALQVVLQSAHIEGGGGIATLRAKRNLEESGREERQWKQREDWVKLRALLELLTASSAAMLAVFDTHLLSDGLLPGSVPHESMMVATLLMLYRHSTVLRNPTPSSLLRNRLQKAMEDYPSNSIVLGMFLQGEKGQGVWGRVRGILGGGAGRDKDVARRVAEVWIAGWERGRWEAEVERTRGGLGTAVQSEMTRGSALLWRVYIEFEIRVGQLRRAKNLLYRAIGDCPLVKEFYLLAFGPLRSVFTAHELNAFADTMAERQIRLRRGLDEVLEGLEIPGNHEGNDSDSGGSEIEHNANELRRLMPY